MAWVRQKIWVACNMTQTIVAEIGGSLTKHLIPLAINQLFQQGHDPYIVVLAVIHGKTQSPKEGVPEKDTYLPEEMIEGVISAPVPGVEVPKDFINANGTIMLKVGMSQVVNFHIDEEAERISFQARFNKVSHSIFIPFYAIAALTTKNPEGKGFTQHLNILNVVDKCIAELTRLPTEVLAVPIEKPKPKLSLVN